MNSRSLLPRISKDMKKIHYLYCRSKKVFKIILFYFFVNGIIIYIKLPYKQDLNSSDRKLHVSVKLFYKLQTLSNEICIYFLIVNTRFFKIYSSLIKKGIIFIFFLYLIWHCVQVVARTGVYHVYIRQQSHANIVLGNYSDTFSLSHCSSFTKNFP